MRTCRATLAASCAALVAAATASAAGGLVVVHPQAPVVGKRATIVAEGRAVQPVTLELVSPTGIHRRVRMRSVAPGRWRAAYSFADDGQWLLRVRRLRLESSVWVQQPPSAFPPYRPSSRTAGVTGVLGQGSFVFP